MNIYLSKNFLRSYKKLLNRNPRLNNTITKKLILFEDNPNHPSLRLHKLQGTMVTDWSISIASDLRLIFTYVEDGILLVDVGKHEDVYRE